MLLSRFDWSSLADLFVLTEGTKRVTAKKILKRSDCCRSCLMMIAVESKAELELHNVSCDRVDNVDDNRTQL